MRYQERTKPLLQMMNRRKADAFLLTHPLNVTYLTGFTGDDSSLILTKNDAFLVTDGRYREQAETQAPWLQVILRKGNMFNAIADLAAGLRLTRMLFEEDHIAYGDFAILHRHSRASLQPSRGVVEALRTVKRPQELRLIRKALSIAQQALRAVKPAIKPGIRECDIAAALVYAMRRRGADKEAFDIIVASGPRSSLPHAKTATRKIREGDLLLVDWGAQYRGYCSDLTRTFFVGNIPDEGRRIYRTLLAAQNHAITEIRPGRGGKRIDGAARAVIRKAGYGGNFMHGLGHGIGLAVHESPSISPSASTRIRQNMVFSVEPGIYIPGWGGIRIEDMVQVTSAGAKRLSTIPRNLHSATIPS